MSEAYNDMIRIASDLRRFASAPSSECMLKAASDLERTAKTIKPSVALVNWCRGSEEASKNWKPGTSAPRG